MSDLLWAIPFLPLLGFVVLALAGRRLSRRAVAWIGAGSVGLAAVVALATAASFIASPPPSDAAVQALPSWFEVAGLSASFSLRLDPLATVMMLVVTGVGFLILLYSTEFMADDADFSRFFAYLDLFVGAMLVLVLASDLVLLLLGWEGVGLCSYLLIGFWYRDPANGRAARKAFVVTRIGDAALLVGMLLLFTHLGTLDIQELMTRAPAAWPVGSGTAVIAASLLLAGALGKSAQLPLQTWLPDAMAGPTPVSALIHAATMVTAGVYLIARTHTLFELAPPVLAAVGIIGALTLILAGFAAIAQRDIKRVLAYSTISQLGYMFVALGVGAWSAAIFHLMTHAFFKAALFLGAGAVILACQHEHDLYRLGGLRKRMPVTFWTFVASAAALAGVPLVTAGFYSKDLILADAWQHGAYWLWGAAWIGVVLTGIYTTRLVLLAFFGDVGIEPDRRPGARIAVPLIVLGVLSVIGGLVELPASLGGLHALSGFLAPSFAGPPPVAQAAAEPPVGTELVLEGLAALASLGGIALAWLWFSPSRHSQRTPRLPARVRELWASGFGFDRVYELAITRPFTALGIRNRNDVVDGLVRGVVALVRFGHREASATQTGRLRGYAAGVVVGAVVAVGLAAVVFVLVANKGAV